VGISVCNAHYAARAHNAGTNASIRFWLNQSAEWRRPARQDGAELLVHGVLIGGSLSELVWYRWSYASMRHNLSLIPNGVANQRSRGKFGVK